MGKREKTQYNTYEDIPLFLDSLDIVHALDITKQTAYNMMYACDFPTIIIGGRKMVRKDKLFAWLEKHKDPEADKRKWEEQAHVEGTFSRRDRQKV